MSRIKTTQNVSNVSGWEDLRRYVSIVLDDIVSVINGRVSITENCDTRLLSVSFSAANTAATVQHGLGRIPTGYIVAGSTAAMSVYDGGVANTDTFLYLKSSAIGTAQIILF